MHVFAEISQQLDRASGELAIDNRLADLRQIARLADRQLQSQLSEIERLQRVMSGVRWPDPRIHDLEAGLRAAQSEHRRLASLSRRAGQRANHYQREVWQPAMLSPVTVSKTRSQSQSICQASLGREQAYAQRRGTSYRSGD
ncbi:hypothetical protein [Chitinimonas naiadis]